MGVSFGVQYTKKLNESVPAVPVNSVDNASESKSRGCEFEPRHEQTISRFCYFLIEIQKVNIMLLTLHFRGKPIPGRGQPARYPVDVLKLDGLFSLNREDIIYISRPPNEEFNDNIRYNNREGFAHFGGYMVEPTGPCITWQTDMFTCLRRIREVYN